MFRVHTANRFQFILGNLQNVSDNVGLTLVFVYVLFLSLEYVDYVSVLNFNNQQIPK
jgi:hypothetical protein